MKLETIAHTMHNDGKGITLQLILHTGEHVKITAGHDDEIGWTIGYRDGDGEIQINRMAACQCGFFRRGEASPEAGELLNAMFGKVE